MKALVENTVATTAWSNNDAMYVMMPDSQFCAPKPDDDLEGFVHSFQRCLSMLDRIFAYAA